MVSDVSLRVDSVFSNMHPVLHTNVISVNSCVLVGQSCKCLIVQVIAHCLVEDCSSDSSICVSGLSVQRSSMCCRACP